MDLTINGINENEEANTKENNYMADNLYRLVKHHKSICDGNCNVSLASLIPIYETLRSRKITKVELNNFT